VDHRIPYDLNYSINRPAFTQGWKEAYKQRFIGNMIKGYGLYISGAVVLLGIFGSYADALYRESKPLSHQSAAFTGGKTVGRSVHFQREYKNKMNDLGDWNHNFACFEKEPNCGKDFDLVAVKK
jgi:hypothetical protein